MEKTNNENTILANSLEEATKIDDSIFEQYMQKENIDEIFEADEFIPIYGLNKHSFCNSLLQYGKKMKYDKVCPKTIQEKNYKKIKSYIKTNRFSIEDLPCNDPFINDYVVDQKLFEYLEQDVLESDDNLEKICKFYVRCCRTLSFDPEFYACGQKGKSARYHEDISNLKNINLYNPYVVCYEFCAIFAKFLQKHGIKYMINTLKPLEYGKTHKSITTEIAGIPILIDPSKLMFHDDFFHAKVCQELVGFKCLSSKKSHQEKINTTLINVYNSYLNNKIDNYSATTAFDWSGEYNLLSFYNELYSIEDIEEKFDILKDYTTTDLPYFEKICQVAFCARTLYATEIANGQFQLSCIHNKTNNMPILVFATNQEKDGVAHPTKFWLNKYFVYDGSQLIKYSMQNLQSKFDNEEYGYIYKQSEIDDPNAINYERRIPGIFDYSAPVLEK